MRHDDFRRQAQSLNARIINRHRDLFAGIAKQPDPGNRIHGIQAILQPLGGALQFIDVVTTANSQNHGRGVYLPVVNDRLQYALRKPGLCTGDCNANPVPDIVGVIDSLLHANDRMQETRPDGCLYFVNLFDFADFLFQWPGHQVFYLLDIRPGKPDHHIAVSVRKSRVLLPDHAHPGGEAGDR